MRMAGGGGAATLDGGSGAHVLTLGQAMSPARRPSGAGALRTRNPTGGGVTPGGCAIDPGDSRSGSDSDHRLAHGCCAVSVWILCWRKRRSETFAVSSSAAQ
jgi:hypothetical protein